MRLAGYFASGREDCTEMSRRVFYPVLVGICCAVGGIALAGLLTRVGKVPFPSSVAVSLCVHDP